MRILRVVQDYWPSTGGNERWGYQHDRWFSEVAGDDVQVVVLRPEWYFRTERFRSLMDGFTFPGEFEVPGLPRVRAYQEIFPVCGGLQKMRAYRRQIGRWLNDSVDVVITQLFQHHLYASWREWPVAFEAPWLLACAHTYHRPECSRGPWMCGHCFREGGPRWWVTDQMKLALYRRYDLILGDELIARDLEKVNLADRVHHIRHLVSPDEMRKPLSAPLHHEQKAAIDRLAERCPIVLLQLSRLHRDKGPHLLLDVLATLPAQYGVAFAGDGPERPALEERVRTAPELRDRVVFLGAVDVSRLAAIAERVSAFTLLSRVSNHNTALWETMGVGIAPVVAIDCNDFPDAFAQDNPVLGVKGDAQEIAGEVRGLLENEDRARAMTRRARAYIEANHSFDQMWAYRERLMALADVYRKRRQSLPSRIMRFASQS